MTLTPLITADAAPRGLRSRSETADQVSTAPRQLIIEWITQF